MSRITEASVALAVNQPSTSRASQPDASPPSAPDACQPPTPMCNGSSDSMDSFQNSRDQQQREACMDVEEPQPLCNGVADSQTVSVSHEGTRYQGNLSRSGDTRIQGITNAQPPHIDKAVPGTSGQKTVKHVSFAPAPSTRPFPDEVVKSVHSQSEDTHIQGLPNAQPSHTDINIDPSISVESTVKHISFAPASSTPPIQDEVAEVVHSQSNSDDSHSQAGLDESDLLSEDLHQLD